MLIVNVISFVTPFKITLKINTIVMTKTKNTNLHTKSIV